jgi:uncharacterized membrane protein
MRSTVLALTLIAALAAPALAEPEKAADEKATPAHEETVKKAPAPINDPNWTPCDYTSDNDDNGCN